MIRGQRGFTLVELLVAALILGIAIIPLLQIVPGTLAPAQVSETDLRLAAAATRKIEELISLLRSPTPPSIGSYSEACADVPNCRIEWVIALDLSSGVSWLRTVAVTACQDINGNAFCDSGENQVRFNTKVTSRP